MLVQLLHTIAGKVLNCTGHIRVGIFDAFDVGAGVGNDLVRVVAEAACIDDRIAPVFVYVHHRIEHPVAADGRGFAPGHKAQMIGIFGSLASAALGGGGNKSAFRQAAAAAVIAVGCDEQGDLTMLLISGVLAVYRFLVTALPAQAALMAHREVGFDLLLIYTGYRFQNHEKLSQLFLKRHTGDGVLNPLDLLVIEKIGFCVQVYHVCLLLSLICPENGSVKTAAGFRQSHTLCNKMIFLYIDSHSCGGFGTDQKTHLVSFFKFQNVIDDLFCDMRIPVLCRTRNVWKAVYVA